MLELKVIDTTVGQIGVFVIAGEAMGEGRQEIVVCWGSADIDATPWVADLTIDTIVVKATGTARLTSAGWSHGEVADLTVRVSNGTKSQELQIAAAVGDALQAQWPGKSAATKLQRFQDLQARAQRMFTEAPRLRARLQIIDDEAAS